MRTAIALGVLTVVVAARPELTTYALASGVVALAAAFMVRGYEIDGTRLFVRRLGWTKTIDLNALKSVEAVPEAMEGSLRPFGIGGLFSYVGHFRNARLGWYRAYATDPRRSVVLRFPGHNVVVTPDDPKAFVAAIRGSSGGTPSAS